MYDPVRLAALVAVAEAGSITRAAERLGYTTPALSQQLAKLEREAGTALLVRHHRGTRLTGAGELLFQSDLPPAALRQNVTSPGGTTAAALEVLMANDGMQPLMTRAIAAATRRSKELAK